ncbi:MFS transporter [Ruminococcaceae bacterium OttesenSCG-928-L11]|nr:MFS transporter [Ruminococcaceae bacterium OttesenSCG-928-L11]
MNQENASAKSKPALSKLHYAWVIAFAGMLISGAGVGIVNSTLGVFVRPVCEELGFLRGQFTLYSSISTLVCVVLMPVFGTLFRRFGFRRIAVIGAIACGLVLMGYSFSSKLWHFYLFAFLSGIFVNGIGIMSVGILVNQWFIDKKGLATGIAYSGSGLVAAILIPITNKFIELHGWRWGYRFLAIISLSVLLLVILFVVQNKPEDKGLEPYRTGESQKKSAQPSVSLDVGLTREEAFHKTAFWMLAIAVMGITLCQAGPHVHTASFLSDIGYSSAFASSVSSVYMLLLTACKVVMGYVFDKLGSLKGSLLIGGCCVLFPIVALFAANPVIPWVYIVFLAMASSGATILATVLTTNYFGGKDFSRVYSIISMFSYFGITISSPLLGTIYDLTGGYTVAWILIACVGIVVCACLIGTNRLSRSIVFENTKKEVEASETV